MDSETILLDILARIRKAKQYLTRTYSHIVMMIGITIIHIKIILNVNNTKYQTKLLEIDQLLREMQKYNNFIFG